MDRSAPSSPGSLFACAIFRNSMGFFIAAFTKEIGWGYPLEAELASIQHDILYAFDRTSEKHSACSLAASGALEQDSGCAHTYAYYLFTHSQIGQSGD
ncbi:hypothetical protein ACS0TY_011057 [Phlomoides rotata]